MSAITQQTEEWLTLRRSKIGASDAPVIMEVSPWKTPLQLWEEKIYQKSTIKTDRMQRGLDLENSARELFFIKTGVQVEPKVVFHPKYDWMMASLDGISSDDMTIVEIKCPGRTDHQMALNGKVPEHYFPQLQHQMEVCGVSMMYYFSFDGYDGALVKVERDDDYINILLSKEKQFYLNLHTKTPPESTLNDYTKRNDEIWQHYASEWLSVTNSLKELQEKEKTIRENLVQLCGNSNAMGAGIKICKVLKKGMIDYQKIPELQSVDLEKYRKEDTTYWKVIQN